MRYSLLSILALVCLTASAQKCPKNSILYRFEKNAHPRNFTEHLGNHPEFPFLQRVNGVRSVAAFIQSINNLENQTKYDREFKAFDLLLRNSGFTRGYQDLTEKSVEKVYINPGTIGNLGFYDRVNDRISYIYVSLRPAGEDPMGVEAWKVTNSAGCYLYVLHTCGNAFYPDFSAADECCKLLSVENSVYPLEIKNDSVEKPVHITVNYYEGRLVPARKARSKSGYDTIFRLIRHRDTVSTLKTRDGRPLKIFSNPQTNKILICTDTVLKTYSHLMIDTAALASEKQESIRIIFSDTLYVKDTVKNVSSCDNNWEIALDGGMSFNNVPRLSSATTHTQTNGMQLAGEFAIGKFVNRWLIAGISASYIVLSYQDDFPYAGSVAGTYNTIFLGKPIIPIQLFGKAIIGKPVGWQSTVHLSIGYAMLMNPKIVSGGNTLAAKPDLNNGLTAGAKLGVAYFFTCKFGLGVTCSWQYFSNTGSLTNYNPMALLVTGGLKIRF